MYKSRVNEHKRIRVVAARPAFSFFFFFTDIYIYVYVQTLCKNTLARCELPLIVIGTY